MSSNIKDKKKKSAVKTEKKTQTILFRLMMVLALDIIGVSLLKYIKDARGREEFFVYTALPKLTIIFAALSVLALGYFVFAKIKKINTSKHTCTPLMILGTMLVCLFICMFYKNIQLQKIIITIFVMSLLYFVYYLYKRSFWIYSIYSAAAYMAMLLFGQFTNIRELNISIKIAAIIASVGIGILAAVIIVRGGAKKIGKGRVTLFEDKLDAVPFSVTSGLLLITAAVSFFTSAITGYMCIALFASFLIIAIVYTIKMI